jgi:hypothetical protein
MEVGCADRRVKLNRQLGYRLTDIPVVMHDFIYGKAHPEQVVPMQGCGFRDIWVRWRVGLGPLPWVSPCFRHKRLAQLVQEDMDPVLGLTLFGS